MNTTGEKSSEKVLEGTEKLQKEIDRLLGDITVKLLGDEQKQQTVIAIAETVMANWSAGNPFKKMIAYLALKSLPALPADGMGSDRTADMAADLGRLMVLRWTLQSHENRADPSAAGKKLTGFIKAFLENTDVSAWKNMLEASRESKIETARQLNETLPDYQGKLLVIIAALPTIISIIANSVQSYLQTQLKVMPPEMVFEVFSGLNGCINWKEVGLMLNDHYELIRRIHIGSSLGGDGTKSAVQNLVGDALKDIVSGIDPQRYADAMTGTAETKEAVKNAVSDMMHACPGFAEKMITAAALSGNARIRGIKNRLQVLADMPDEELVDVTEKFAQAFDEQERADLISLIVETTNRIYAGNPERIPQTVSALAASVDDGELLELAESGLLNDILKAVKPLATILMPTVIHGICDLLTPEPDDENEELHAALARLAGIMGGLNAD